MESRENIFSIDLSSIKLPRLSSGGPLIFSDDYIAISERKLLGSRELDDLLVTIRELSDELEGLSSSEMMARVIEIYEMWYEHIRSYERSQGVADFYCHKGCSSCCHQPVKASGPEAEYIMNYAAKNNIDIDHQLLNKQLTVLESYDQIDRWKAELGPHDSRCIFLDSNSGSCMVHEVRPLNCRNFFSVGSSDYCGKSTKGLSEVELSSVKQVRFDKLAEIATAFLNVVGGRSENSWLVDRVHSILSRS